MTLDEFIDGRPWRAYDRAWVDAPGFRRLYVRKNRRMYGNHLRDVLDLASMDAAEPGSGAFATLVARLQQKYPRMVLYIENVLTERFASYLERDGWVRDERHPADRCYFLIPKEKPPTE